MNKRMKVRIISFSLAAAAVFAGVIFRMRQTVDEYRIITENNYSAALADLNAALGNISETSEKIGYIGSPHMLSSLAAKLYCEAEIAKSALSRLPVSGDEFKNINLFLSQVGNYAMSVSDDLIRNGTVERKQSENFIDLSKTARLVAKAVDDWNAQNDKSGRWSADISGIADNAAALASTLSETEETLTDYAGLIYDGPYSEHILDKSPVLLQNAPEVNEQQAAEKAAAALPGSGSLNCTGIINAKAEQYCFERGGAYASVCVKGGELYFMRSGRTVEDSRMGYDEALSAARGFLQKILGENMRETYYFISDGVCVINFATVRNGVICYTELVKIGVALDNGEILFYEAGGYIFNHRERNFPEKINSESSAEEKLSPLLSKKSVKQAVIPTAGGGESLCYEFECTGIDGRELLVYINAETLSEEQLFILLRSDGGTLVR